MYLDCLPCFLRQALEAARRVTADERAQRAVLDAVALVLPTLPLDATPIDLGREVHRVVRDTLGVDDPYREAKRRDNDRVVALLPALRERVQAASDPLLAAVRLAAAGNAIDLAVSSDVDLERTIERGLEDGGGMADYPVLRARLACADDVLYLGDNAGEIVFDRLLIERLVALGARVTFAVRGRPILNDATKDDAAYVGMDEVAEVISSGSDGPGTTLGACRPDFLDAFRGASLILSKGQGNFEGLSDERAPLFFLLMVKCPVVARELEAPIGTVLLRAPRS